MIATTRRAFTLIELLIVVGIIGILAAIGLYNFRQASDRALKVADAGNLHTIAVALQVYRMDYNRFPPADREAGPFMSHDRSFVAVGNGPAGGGSWDGVPWLLYEYKYISDWHTLFTPKYLRLYPGGATHRGNYPRFHNFRYAYNSAAMSSGGPMGGDGNLETGTRWLVRNLFVDAKNGFYGASYPAYPADFRYPWGEGDMEGKLEHVLYADLAVRTVVGGKNITPEQAR